MTTTRLCTHRSGDGSRIMGEKKKKKMLIIILFYNNNSDKKTFTKKNYRWIRLILISRTAVANPGYFFLFFFVPSDNSWFFFYFCRIFVLILVWSVGGECVFLYRYGRGVERAAAMCSRGKKKLFKKCWILFIGGRPPHGVCGMLRI